jgi:hypothetical protein
MKKKVLNGHPKRWAQDMHICEQAKPTSHAINRMSLGWLGIPATRKKDYFHSSHSSGKSEEGLRRMQRITIR